MLRWSILGLFAIMALQSWAAKPVSVAQLEQALSAMDNTRRTDAEIAAFCDTSYHVTFPIFSKIEVNGANAHPLYVWLKSQKGGLLGSAIKWNFSKFLIDRNGEVQGRFAPTATPESLAKDIEALL